MYEFGMNKSWAQYLAGLLLGTMLFGAGCSVEDYPEESDQEGWNLFEDDLFDQTDLEDNQSGQPTDENFMDADFPDEPAPLDAGTGDENSTEPEEPAPDADPTPESDIVQEPEELDGGSTEDASGTAEDTDPASDSNTPQECDDEVVNFAGDAENCGDCGIVCDPNFGVCQNGVCGCTQGLTACGTENRCEDLEADPNHCGECGVQCDTGQICRDGECVCRDEFTDCDGICRDTRREPQHCGSCDNSCGTGNCLQSECVVYCGGVEAPCRFEGSQGRMCKPPTDDAWTELTCGPATILSCQPGCGAAEACRIDAGCRGYRVARGCTECPCNDCEMDEVCAVDDPVEGGIYCISTN